MDPAADIGAGLLQLGEIIGVEKLQAPANTFDKIVVLEKVPIGFGGGGKPIGYPHPLRTQVAIHLAQRSVFASDNRNILDPQFGKCADVAHASGTK